MSDDPPEAEQVRKIKIEIGADRITESIANDDPPLKDSLNDRKNSVSSLDAASTGKFESTSPKSHKLSLKQKFKQAFTSPPSIRRVVQTSDDFPSPFKRSPASFREKIVKTFSPESMRKKQSTAEGGTINDEGCKLSPTAPPRRKHRKKTNIEEDFDSSPEGYQEDESMNDAEAETYPETPPETAVTSPDSILDAEGINETVTVEVHAVEGSPNDLSEFEFEKSFLNKSEKSLLEEVTSELAQKTDSVFPAESFVEFDEQCLKDAPDAEKSKDENGERTPVSSIDNDDSLSAPEDDTVDVVKSFRKNCKGDEEADNVFAEGIVRIDTDACRTVQDDVSSCDSDSTSDNAKKLPTSSKSRTHSCGFFYTIYGANPRERWSYPPPERFSPLDESKRKFESEIGREIVRDRRMKHELQQIQALNLKNKQQQQQSPNIVNSPSGLIVSSSNPVPFELHPLKPIPSNDASVIPPEPAEADVVPDKSIGNLPEVGARTGSVSSDKNTDDDDDDVKSPTSPQRSFIPRRVSPSKSPTGTGLPPSPPPTANNRESSVELRRSRRANSTTNQKNLRNSDPNGVSAKVAEHRNKRHSEPEIIMAKSFPPRTLYLRRQETKTSVKELLNKFEKKPVQEHRKSSQSAIRKYFSLLIVLELHDSLDGP